MGEVLNISATPRPKDTRWKIRAKIITQARLNSSDTAASTAPMTSDTKRRQLDKIQRIFGGTN